jgi:hypothetical protein
VPNSTLHLWFTGSPVRSVSSGQAAGQQRRRRGGRGAGAAGNAVVTKGEGLRVVRFASGYVLHPVCGCWSVA